MSSSFGDNKRKPGAGASAVTEARRLATIAQTWTSPSKGPRVTTGTQVAEVMARNAGILGLKYAEQNGAILSTSGTSSQTVSRVFDFTPAGSSGGYFKLSVVPAFNAGSTQLNASFTNVAFSETQGFKQVIIYFDQESPIIIANCKVIKNGTIQAGWKFTVGSKQLTIEVPTFAIIPAEFYSLSFQLSLNQPTTITDCWIQPQSIA